MSVEVMNRCVPIIVILGGTGTGKSKLGIQIAKRIGGEIISADSMQVYKGLDILTNKVTEDEKEGVVHHLMDFVVPPRTYNVVDFRNEALPIMDRLLAQKRSPVIVGGTNYYIESLLWKVLISNDAAEDGPVSENQSGMEQLAFRLGLRPLSGGTFKRKVDENDKPPLDALGRFLLTVREVSHMSQYPARVLNTLMEKLKGCTEDRCVELMIDESLNVDDDDETLEKLNTSNDYCSNCQKIRKNLVEVIGLKKETKFLVEQWQKLNPLLDFHQVAKAPDEVNHKNLAAVEESLLDFHRRLKLLLVAPVQRLVADFGTSLRLEIDVEDVPSPELHTFLTHVDRQQALILHPNNKRKIVRSLVVWAESGRKHSDILNEQKRDGSFLGGPLRYKDIIIFWLTCNKAVLDARLDDRVDQMLERGLVEEILDFYNKYKPSDLLKMDSRPKVLQSKEQFTKGIFQSIGFRNFSGYLSLDEEKRKGAEGEKMLQEGRETFRIDTRRYVKYQNKWVRNRFLYCPTREVPPVYNLDTTNVDEWTESVLEPAMEVVLNKMAGEEAVATRLQPVTVEAMPGAAVSASDVLTEKHSLHHCDICDRTLVGRQQLEDHLRSARHKKVLQKIRRKSQETS